jgi:hypothetical protein
MRKQKIFFHVIEDSGYGRIGWHECFEDQAEARKLCNSLSEMFPQYQFYIEALDNEKEPNFITV